MSERQSINHEQSASERAITPDNLLEYTAEQRLALEERVNAHFEGSSGLPLENKYREEAALNDKAALEEFDVRLRMAGYDDVLAAQELKDELNFKADANDHVRASADIRDAKADFFREYTGAIRTEVDVLVTQLGEGYSEEKDAEYLSHLYDELQDHLDFLLQAGEISEEDWENIVDSIETSVPVEEEEDTATAERPEVKDVAGTDAAIDRLAGELGISDDNLGQDIKDAASRAEQQMREAGIDPNAPLDDGEAAADADKEQLEKNLENVRDILARMMAKRSETFVDDLTGLQNEINQHNDTYHDILHELGRGEVEAAGDDIAKRLEIFAQFIAQKQAELTAKVTEERDAIRGKGFAKVRRGIVNHLRKHRKKYIFGGIGVGLLGAGLGAAWIGAAGFGAAKIGGVTSFGLMGEKVGSKIADTKGWTAEVESIKAEEINKHMQELAETERQDPEAAMTLFAKNSLASSLSGVRKRRQAQATGAAAGAAAGFGLGALANLGASELIGGDAGATDGGETDPDPEPTEDELDDNGEGEPSQEGDSTEEDGSDNGEEDQSWQHEGEGEPEGDAGADVETEPSIEFRDVQPGEGLDAYMMDHGLTIEEARVLSHNPEVMQQLVATGDMYVNPDVPADWSPYEIARPGGFSAEGQVILDNYISSLRG